MKLLSSKWFRIWIVFAVLWIGSVTFLNLDYLTQVVRFEIGWRKGLEKQAKDHPEMKGPKGFLLKELSDPVYRSMGLHIEAERKAFHQSRQSNNSFLLKLAFGPPLLALGLLIGWWWIGRTKTG